MQWIIRSLLMCAFCTLATPRLVDAFDGEYLTVRSEVGDLAYGVQRGAAAISITEIWVASKEDNGRRRIKTYPGELGDLFFDPAGEVLIYLERSLQHRAWASYYYGGQSLPITNNRIWKLSLDGEKEELWPLPEDFQPNEITLSPDGRTLAITGYRGSFFERINNGLWVLDKAGGVRLLLAGKLKGPVIWSADGKAVTCHIDDGSKSIRVHVGTAKIIQPKAEVRKSKIEKRDRESISKALPTEALRETDSSEIVLGLIGTGLDFYIRARNAVHRGNDTNADQLFKNARRAFRRLFDKAPEYGLSRKSCARYIEVCEYWIETKKNAIKTLICQEHMIGMLGLIQEFQRVQDNRDLADLGELHQWAVQRIVADTPSGNARKDRIAILGVLFSCPANSDYPFLSDYLYKHERLPGAPALACFWHSGEQIYGTSGPQGNLTKRSALQPASVDSLASLGRLALDMDNPEQARLIFRNIARQRPKDPDAYIRLA